MIVNPYMCTETVHSTCVLEALFLLTMVINGIVPSVFRVLVMLLWRDFSVGYSFSAMESQDKICTDTSVLY